MKQVTNGFFDPNAVWNGTFNFPTDPEKPIQSNILVDGSRLKKYADNLYLKDQTEFQIEMFNPNTLSYGVKIKLNGHYISNNHLIIKPGQRIVLDRYIDKSEKFKFTSYDIDLSSDALDATKDVGKVQLEFYRQVTQNNIATYPFNTITYTDNTVIGTSYNIYGAVNTSIVPTYKHYDNQGNYLINDGSKRVGYVEPGSKSNQKFDNTNIQLKNDFNQLTTYVLLDISLKPFETKDLVRFCTGCGTKSKKKHNFCSNCGLKL